jgi:hypothetical protein
MDNFFTSIELAEEMLNLGTTIVGKACIAYWQCRRAVGKTWGLSPKVVTWLYTFVVRPILSYASLVWWRRVELKNAQESLSRLQRMKCLGITVGMRSTTSTLEVMLMCPPLHLFIKQEARQAANRLLGNALMSRIFYTQRS